MRLGIAVVHYRAEELLERCVESLKRSSVDDFSVVVVDNGSTNGLAWIERDRRFRLISPGKNLGYAAGVNLALKALPDSPACLLLLNPDVELQDDTLAQMVEALEREPEVGAATCRLLLPSGHLDPACRRSEPTALSAFFKFTGLSRLWPMWRGFGAYNLLYLDDSAPHPIDSASGAFLLLRPEALAAVGGGLDERFFLYGEDLDLCRRLREAGYELRYWPAAEATHSKGSNRIRDANTTRHFYRAMWTYYRKWGRGGSNPLVLAPLALALAGLGSLELLRNASRRLGSRWDQS